MQRKRFPIFPFVVVAFAFFWLGKNDEHFPDLSPSVQYAEEEIDVVYPLCGNAISEEADKLFQQNCASCHFRNKDMIGPTLQGCIHRQPYNGWFDLFLTSEDSLYKSGDTTTIKLRKKWNVTYGYYHNFDSLSPLELIELRDLGN